MRPPFLRLPAVARCCRALSDGTRLQVLEILADGERCVCELTDRLGISQPLLSHHLKVLRDEGLIAARREGRWMRYRLRPDGVRALTDSLQRVLERYDGSVRLGRPGCAC
jgi:ArsR family transcriptional regulator